ncbi:MAG: hypothetical protein SH850_25275, partial [Planctomycetaceae bacterium]|nr:hypothetical protein [Planctomycetaceae bacterium]
MRKDFSKWAASIPGGNHLEATDCAVLSPGGASDRSPRRDNISDLCRKSMKLDDPDGVDEQLDPH